MQNFILIGYGNLANSMMQGFSKNTDFQKYSFYVYGRNFDKACEFAKKFSIEAISTLEEKITKDSVLLLCIKPKGIQSLQISSSFAMLYSVMAGVKLQTLKEHFPQAQSYVRAMPNIGASVQKSSTSLFIESEEKEKATALALAITQTFGNAIILDSEDLIDSSIATSGSSPAFLSLVAEALIESGIREGIPYKQSYELVQATFEGFAQLLKNTSPYQIKTLVTSPAGTTAEGLAHLEKKGFKGILEEAGHQAVLKAKGKI